MYLMLITLLLLEAFVLHQHKLHLNQLMLQVALLLQVPSQLQWQQVQMQYIHTNGKLLAMVRTGLQ